MSRLIEHNPAQQRFEWVENGALCVLDYELRDQIMTITHTGVPEAAGGRGIAGDLTQFALDTARREGWKIIPVCSYAARYIQNHAQYQDLLA
jgi:predicted GNAT family acetyltransferase